MVRGLLTQREIMLPLSLVDFAVEKADQGGYQRVSSTKRHSRPHLWSQGVDPGGIYLLKVNNRNTRTRCIICLKLTIKTPERRQWRR